MNRESSEALEEGGTRNAVMGKPGATPNDATIASARRCPVISADNATPVTVSSGITGPLPNCIFTLCPSTIISTLLTSGCSPETSFLCRKFANVMQDFERTATYQETQGTVITHTYGSVFIQGANVAGRAGVGSAVSSFWIPDLIRIRLPPVLSVDCDHGRWLAWTTRGVYHWGPGYPTPTHLPSVADAWLTAWGVLYHKEGETGLTAEPPEHQAGLLALISPSEVTSVWSSQKATFINRAHGNRLVAFGASSYGQLGIRSGTDPLAGTVALPDDVRATHVVNTMYTTIITDASQSCWATGWNDLGQLGVGTEENRSTPARVALPGPVVGVLASSLATVWILMDEVYVAGSNEYGLFPIDENFTLPEPTPIPLPWPATSIERASITVTGLYLMVDGQWWTTGETEGTLGWQTTPVPARLPLDDVQHIFGTDYTTFFVRDDGIWATGVLPVEPDSEPVETRVPVKLTVSPSPHTWARVIDGTGTWQRNI